MLTTDDVKGCLRISEKLAQRLAILQRVTELEPRFQTPYIAGGYLRDIVLQETPSDCDVLFVDPTSKQTLPEWVLKVVRAAEAEIGFGPFTDWEFWNMDATKVSGNIVADVIGFYSHHTDYLAQLMCSSAGEILIGSPEKTLADLSNRIYDVRYQGLLVRAALHERSYHSVLAVTGLRGLYLCYRIHLSPSPAAKELFQQLPALLASLSTEEKTALLNWYQGKTSSYPKLTNILKEYGINYSDFSEVT